MIASTIPRFSARARPTACTYFLRPRSVPCGSLAYVSLSQSLLDVVAQARAREKREGRGEGRSVLYEISPAFNLGRGYVVISVQDTATLWKPEPLTWRERAITRLAGHAPWCVYWKNSDAISDRWQRRFATRVVESLTRAKLVTKRSSSPSHPRSVIYRSLAFTSVLTPLPCIIISHAYSIR